MIISHRDLEVNHVLVDVFVPLEGLVLCDQLWSELTPLHRVYLLLQHLQPPHGSCARSPPGHSKDPNDQLPYPCDQLNI